MAQNQHGFTLIEVLITIVLLAIITSGLMAMFTAFSQSNGDPSVITQATEFAQEKLEQMIADKNNPAVGFNNLASGGDAPMVGFSRSWNVFYVNTSNLNATALPVGTKTNYRNVTVVVTSKAGSVTTSTLVGSY